MQFQLLLDPKKIHRQSLREINFLTRNAVDRFWGDYLLSLRQRTFTFK